MGNLIRGMEIALELVMGKGPRFDGLFFCCYLLDQAFYLDGMERKCLWHLHNLLGVGCANERLRKKRAKAN